MKRRKFLKSVAALAGTSAVLQGCKVDKKIGGNIIGASANIGHLLRDKTFAEPTITEQKEVVIIGGGVSGLSAARHLHQTGIKDFVVLDLENKMGGNAANGSNAISGFPWGAHYVPTPNNNLIEYILFLQQCGVVTAIDVNGLPTYNELHLCFDPQERLYINGRWQEGLVPQYGVPSVEALQIKRFLDQVNEFRYAKGKDGKEAFAIPVNDSSKDEKYTALDNLTMKKWMESEGYTSPYLHWYINYCTRDDFGTNYDVASAWAGIHYFAGRKGKGTNAEHQDVLTWPQGNGFLAQHLQKDLENNLRSQSLVVKVYKNQDVIEIDYYNVALHQLQRIQAKQCIIAVPQFVAARMLNDAKRIQKIHEYIDYTPWMVANFTVNKLQERSGAPLSWDNVVYDSDSLGYVVATHELTQQLMPQKNLTYYLPLTKADPTTERRLAQSRTHEEWVKMIVADLQKVHPQINAAIDKIDIMVWGHAMARPKVGMIHGATRHQLAESIANCIHFAHTDLAGVSIFEEAFYQGLNAAKKVTAQLTS